METNKKTNTFQTQRGQSSLWETCKIHPYTGFRIQMSIWAPWHEKNCNKWKKKWIQEKLQTKEHWNACQKEIENKVNWISKALNPFFDTFRKLKIQINSPPVPMTCVFCRIVLTCPVALSPLFLRAFTSQCKWFMNSSVLFRNCLKSSIKISTTFAYV